MKYYEVKLTQEDLTVISEALMFAPYGKVAGVINSINRQIAEEEKGTQRTGGGIDGSQQ